MNILLIITTLFVGIIFGYFIAILMVNLSYEDARDEGFNMAMNIMRERDLQNDSKKGVH